ncbi:hypothetical protein RRG08_045126 [Elysia crispata]|uniref:Uncharacterized protein n=1 Tax=Elysia crispata TaxID=231223 RepID=A0AAE1D429_9GAST|nr:hypothetical protein RRG08_045126 [Elysia crispata]
MRRHSPLPTLQAFALWIVDPARALGAGEGEQPLAVREDFWRETNLTWGGQVKITGRDKTGEEKSGVSEKEE